MVDVSAVKTKAGARALLGLLLAGLLALGVAACGSSDDGAGSDGDAKGLEVFNLAQNSAIMQPGLAFLWLGDYTGYYKQEGLKVNVVQTQGPSDALQRLASGTVDAAFPPPAAVLQAAAEGHDLNVVTPFVLRRHSQYRVAVLPDSPIKTPEGIVGKKVGVVNLNDEGVNFTRAVLREAGAKPDDVTLIPVGNTGQAATELTKGNVDALVLPGVQYAQIRALKDIKIEILDGPPFVDQVVGNALWVKKDWLADPQHKDVLRRFLRAFVKEMVFFTTNPKAALQIHFKMYPNTIPPGETAEQAVAENLPQVLINLDTFKVEQTACPKWGCSEEAAWKFYVTYLGLDPDDVGDVTRFYTNEFIKDINSQDLEQVAEEAKNFQLK